MIVMMLFIWCCGSKKQTENPCTGEQLVETHRMLIVNYMWRVEIMTLDVRYKKFIFLRVYKLIWSDE
jgi:hypothetical protein